MIPKFKIWVKKENKLRQVTELEFEYNKLTGIQSCYNWYLPEEIELLQWTGLRDRNGVEIYEGDIILSKWFDETIKAEVKLGKFNVEGGANAWPLIYGFYIKYNLYATSSEGEDVLGVLESLYDIKNKIEVIGNIYQDEEMLK